MPSPARVAAHEALRLISTAELGDVLARTRDPLDDGRDRALATDLISGTLRWRGAIDYQLRRISGKPLERLDTAVLDALRLGAYQLLYRPRLPASAVVNDSVEIVKAAKLKSASAFVNAVLRRLARERSALHWPGRDNLLEHLSIVQSHPDWLVARWIDRYGPAAAEAWVRFNNTPATLTIAPNRTLVDRATLADRLADEDVRTEPTRIAPHGLRVLAGRALGSSAFKAGWLLVQDEASQLIPELVAALPGHVVLDACASPGGKTVALAAHVAPRGVVVATDVRARRMRVLESTLRRCEIGNAYPVQLAKSGALPFADGAFDAVLVDAPCSGLGTVRRDPDIKWKRTALDLPVLARTQLDLLRRVAAVVKPGGRLVYSTCSSEPEENEAVVEAFLGGSDEFELVPLDRATEVAASIRACATPAGCLRTNPALHGLEAFFAAILRRRVVR